MTRSPALRAGWAGPAFLAVAACGLGLLVDRRVFFACWLAAWWACASAVLGSQANLWLHDLSGGSWGVPLRPVWRSVVAAMPMLLALMLPLLAAAWTFYPWSQSGWQPDSRHPGFQAAWLSPAFVTVRLIAYAALWQLFALLPTRRKGVSAAGLLIYAVTLSLAAVDLVQSLTPQWHSSGFGLLAIGMSMKLGFALGVAMALSPASRCARAGASPMNLPPQLGRDWGNLLLMYVLMWAYLGFVQFLIIWAENLPPEIAWYVPRLQTGWVWLAVALVVGGFFLPLLLLLFRAFKQHRRALRILALALCALGWLESVWITLPSVRGLGWHAVWMAPLILAAMAFLLWRGAGLVQAAPPACRNPDGTPACKEGRL